MKMKINKIKVLMLTMCLVFGCTTVCFAGIFEAGESLINDGYGFFVKIATAAAGIGVGFGAMKVKFAKGDPQDIKTGEKAIKASIIAWAVLIGLPLILTTIEGYIGQ